MFSNLKPRNHFAFVSAALLLLLSVSPVHAICSDPLTGKWTDRGGQGRDPASFDVVFTGCGDTNFETTSYGVTVWSWSNNSWYARPRVRAEYKRDRSGKMWLRADVPTGGYLEQLYIPKMSTRPSQLRVFIRWKSLDSKPDASEWRTFNRES